MDKEERYKIDVISPAGQPILPKRTKHAFTYQCGVLVRDSIPITIEQWNKKKDDPSVTFVHDRQKEVLWSDLLKNFILPPEEDPTTPPVIEPKVKAYALKKMAELFKNWKKNLNTQFVEKNKTPDFTGIYVKIKDQWPAFVAYKKSEKARKMSQQNKLNAAKKEFHHVTGSGGYRQAEPKWEKMEKDLLAKGVEPETRNWPDRVRTWVFGNGGALDPETGEVVFVDPKLAIPMKKIEEAIKEVEEGTFHPDREKDVLTKALGNPEHPGRTRGTPGSVPWVHGFHDSRDTYRSRGRKKKEEPTKLQ